MAAPVSATRSRRAAADLVTDKLAEAVEGRDALAVGAAHEAMGRALRNVGRPGLAAWRSPRSTSRSGT